MRVLPVKSVRLDKSWIRYYLLRRDDPKEGYGVCVTYGREAAVIPDIVPSEVQAERLLRAMIAGRVTPVTAWDVTEDWLCG